MPFLNLSLELLSVIKAEEERKKNLKDLLNKADVCNQSKDYNGAKRYLDEYCERYDGDCEEVKNKIETIKEKH